MRRWLGLMLVLLALASGMSARAESAGEGLEARADEVSAAVDLGGFQRAAADAGVLVVAEGARDVSVRLRLQKAVQTVLGIDTARVDVSPMEEAAGGA